MIQIDQDDRRTMYVTRGDHTGDGNNIIAFRYPIYDAVTKQKTYYKFKPTDKIAFVVKKKKGYTKKEVFRVERYLSEAGYTEETEAPEIVLTEEDTKNFTLLNKRQTYWYDIVLNDGVTILGYDLDGASKIVVFPEAGEGDEDDDDEIIYVYPDLEDIVITPSMEEQYFKSEKYGYDHVIVEAIQADELSINSSTDDQEFEGLYKKVSVEGIETTELNVTPSTEAQTFEGLYDKVSVGAVEEVEADELNIVPSKQAQNFEGLYDKVSVEAIQAEQLNVTPSQDQQSFTGLYDAVNVDAIEGETLNASSSTQSQSFTGLYDEVNISGIQTDTLNITPSQQQQSFTGLYDEVNVSAIQADTLNITPTKEAQTRTGLYNQVNVSGDNNLVASNIKKNVSIFGVTGSYEETPSLQSKSVTITENGTQTVSPDSGYDGLSSVAITTNVSGSGDEWYIDNAAYLFTEGTRLNSLSNLLPLIKNATNAKQMFNACRNVQTLDLTSFDTAGIKYMNEMFQYCTKLTGVTIGDKWDMSSVEDANSMFYNCSNLTYEGVDWSKFDTRRLINCSTMFARCEKLVTAPVLDLSAVTTQSGMFSGCYALKNVPAYSIPNAMSTLYNMFQSCSQLTEESLNNILAICISAVKITGSEKTLQRIGLTSAQATTCQGLSNYQAFLDAGWTTGY